MMIGANKNKVIDNIKKAVEKGEYNKKVEIDDPNITSKQEKDLIKNYMDSRNTVAYKLKNKVARGVVSIVTNIQNKKTKIVGIENIKNINSGAIITSNHFNPLDVTIIQKLIKVLGKKRLYIISQVSNLAMNGFVGFFMNYADIIPLSKQIGYMKREFAKLVKNTLKKKNYILIYPEEEMWFNYRKPRMLKQGAYYYAAKNNVPVISCFVEMVDEEKMENSEFHSVKYILHVLSPIYPDTNKTAKENSKEMMEKDYEQKKMAYECAYNKKLNYAFEPTDIAGWVQCEE